MSKVSHYCYSQLAQSTYKVNSGRMSFEVPVGRMAGNQPFQEPRYEILERYLDELRQV